MITLRRGEGEFFDIGDWADIVGRADYSANIDHTKVRLKEIVGSYYLPDEVPCGLAACHRPHLKGYIVSTVEGPITNLGHICGKNHFEVDFVQMRRRFDRDVRIRAYKDTLISFQRRVPELELIVEDLRAEEQGADWVNHHVQRLRIPGEGIDDVRIALGDMVRRGDDRVIFTREATAEERAAQEARERKPTGGALYIEEVRGRVAGLMALSPENDLRQLVAVDLQQGLTRVANLHVSTAPEAVLARDARWAGEVEGKIDRARSIVQSGRRLLTRRNLEVLDDVITEPRQRGAFRTFLATLPKV